MNNVVVSCKNLCKSFGNTEVLKDINFSLYKGDFVSIMGDSGSGKSTFLYLLGGLDKPSQGEVIFLGKDISTLSDKELSSIRSSEMGFVFQFYNLVMNLTVEENILLPLIMAKKNTKEFKTYLDEILNLLGLEDKRKETPDHLSGGQQQRVAIARAIISKPTLLLADEPTGNLDSKSGYDVLEIFKDINKRYSITILMVTHSEKASKVANKVIRMVDGKIEE